VKNLHYTPQSLIKKLQELDKELDWKELLRNGYQKSAVFDADGTLWKDNLSARMIEEDTRNRNLSEKGLNALNQHLIYFNLEPQETIYLAKAKLTEAFWSGELYKIAKDLKPSLNEDEVHEKIWNHYNLLYVGLSPQELEEKATRFLEQGFKDNFYKGMEEVIRYLKRAGFKLYVVSAGVHEFVTAGARLLGFNKSDVHGLKLKVVDGLITSETELPVTYKDGKTQIATKLCGGKPFLVFGDSVSGTDEKILEEAYFPVAVEPEGKDLKIAQEKGYAILGF